MYSYLFNDRGVVVSEAEGIVDGWHVSETKLDAVNIVKLESGEIVNKDAAPRQRSYAIVDSDGLVIHTFETQGAPAGLAPNYIEISAVTPKPQIGWQYKNGTFAEKVVTLEEQKTNMIDSAYKFFIAAKSAIVKENGFGYDADGDSMQDFFAAKERVRDMRDAWLALPEASRGAEPTVQYRVWTTDVEKEFRPHTHAMFVAALAKGAEQQQAAFLWFDQLRSQINAATTKEALQAIQ